LAECQTLLLTVTLHVILQTGGSGGLILLWVIQFMIYQILTSQDSVTLGEAEDLLWHRQVPLKVSIFTWRLLCDR
jgi:hypothetical protein